ncbi:NIPSNAP family protein [Planctomicrobium sp. SH664]|uniref:NIPSNAP family protein n=1 Tax=Planctomicrobium sp. SH664 TaxID=3448125 RepID=UPI003F5CB2E6
MRRLVLAALLFCSIASVTFADDTVYELRIYKANPDKLETLLKRFREHTLNFFEQAGMKNIAYWNVASGPQQHDTLYYILEHASPDAAKASWEKFRANEDWKKVVEESQKKGKILVEKGVTNTFLRKTDYSPAIEPLAPGKLYELRTYTAAEGKLDDLHARFRNHTDKLLQKHGMKAVGYWTPTEAPHNANTLIYILQHENRDAANASWKAFIDDPEWKAAKAESEKNGKLTARPPESVYLTLTDFSPQPKPPEATPAAP